MFKKILIANRGEIAVRIVKACRELGITSAAVYSDIDYTSMHVRAADEAYHIGESTASKSYLDINKIIDTAKKVGADAIHPGYGFLSENAEFIKAVESSGIKFIGPKSESVELMGSKIAARKLMEKHSVPVVPGTTAPLTSVEDAKKVAEGIGYPVLLKASAGGGGKGMRKVFSEDELPDAYEGTRSEALKAFGNDDVYIEKLVENPKHIEVQVLADTHGNYLHLFERECSVQRRHQKIIEEAPSPSLDDETRAKITEAAINAAQACGYINAGTIEFLMDDKKNFYFLEMNTRLQVEHPVTEMITGVDLVKEQIKIAAGEKISFKQGDLQIKGHAVECRVYAEDADNNFAPSTGKVIHHRLPSGPGIRVDRGIDLLSEVSLFYDPMLSKIIAWGAGRTEAIERMKRALGEYQIAGMLTNITLCAWVLDQKEFRNGTFTINFIDEKFMPLIPDKWKAEGVEEYEEVAAVFGALLKAGKNKLNPIKLNTGTCNKWKVTEDE